jgi:hypothetical protein
MDHRRFAIPLTTSSNPPIRSHTVYHVNTLPFTHHMCTLPFSTNAVLKCILWAAFKDGFPTINFRNKRIALHLHPCTQPQIIYNCVINTFTNSLPLIGSGRSQGNQVTCGVADTCCHLQEIPAAPSSRWFHVIEFRYHCLLPTSPIQLSPG